jgi:hypothetical protein
VTAWINGTQTESLTYNGASVYTFDVPGDDTDTPEVEGASRMIRLSSKSVDKRRHKTRKAQTVSSI